MNVNGSSSGLRPSPDRPTDEPVLDATLQRADAERQETAIDVLTGLLRDRTGATDTQVFAEYGPTAIDPHRQPREAVRRQPNPTERFEVNQATCEHKRQRLAIAEQQDVSP